jgi:hypothetical protein
MAVSVVATSLTKEAVSPAAATGRPGAPEVGMPRLTATRAGLADTPTADEVPVPCHQLTKAERKPREGSAEKKL